MSSKRKSSFWEFALIFALVYLITQMAMRTFFPEQFEKGNGVVPTVTLEAQDSTVKGGHHPILVLRNRTEEDLALEDRCPMPPVSVYRISAEEREELVTKETALPCVPLTTIAAGETATIDLAPWKYSLFLEETEYVAELQLPASEAEPLFAEFEIYEPGTVTKLFRTFITKPFLNLLIFFASILPGYSLGIAIILLTILVKIVLFFPTQHALEGQRKLQAIQPKQEELRTKFKDNPQKMQAEMLKLWKENNVNPMQSCLPMLVQFPVLIGLYFVVRDGSVLELSRHLIYAQYLELPWTFGTQFLGLNLLEPNLYVLPPLLVALQFTQMKLSFAIAKKKKESAPKKKGKDEKVSQQEIQQKMMLYGLPIMIGFFAIKFPAAVSLYWGVSTVFGIGQQLYVNRKV